MAIRSPQRWFTQPLVVLVQRSGITLMHSRCCPERTIYTGVSKTVSKTIWMEVNEKGSNPKHRTGGKDLLLPWDLGLHLYLQDSLKNWRWEIPKTSMVKIMLLSIIERHLCLFWLQPFCYHSCLFYEATRAVGGYVDSHTVPEVSVVSLAAPQAGKECWWKESRAMSSLPDGRGTPTGAGCGPDHHPHV